MSLPLSNDPIRASDPVPPAPAAEAAPPAQIPPQEYSVGAPPRPAWAAAPRIDYSRAYAAPAYPPQGGAGVPAGYAPPAGYPPPGYPPHDGGAVGDPRAAAYFARMHAARAPQDDDDEDDDGDYGDAEHDDDAVSQASTKDSKKRAARAALVGKEKAARLAREKNVLTQMMLAAPESALDTLFQAPNVQAAVQEFLQGKLDIDKLERDLIVIGCVRTVKGRHAANRALDNQAPKIADGIWKIAGWGAELGGVVPPGSWELARNEWGAETENATQTQRDWVRTLLAILGGGGGDSATMMLLQQALALATPVLTIGAVARAMAPPAVPASPASYGYTPQPPGAQTYAAPSAASAVAAYTPPAPAPQGYAQPAPAAAPPRAAAAPAPASVPSWGAGAPAAAPAWGASAPATEPVRSTALGDAEGEPAREAKEQTALDEPRASADAADAAPPPITMSYPTVLPPNARVRADDILGTPLEL